MNSSSGHEGGFSHDVLGYSSRGAWSNPSKYLVDRLVCTIREFPDFPREGVLFRDLSGTMSDPFLLRSVATHIALAFEGKFSAVLAVDARGFILGTMVSQISSCRLVLARKLGKLPGAVHRATYEFEYGATALEVQRDALSAEQSVLVVDDVLATGGTLAAAGALVSRAGAKLSGFATALELTELGGRRTLAPYPVFSLLTT